MILLCTIRVVLKFPTSSIDSRLSSCDCDYEAGDRKTPHAQESYAAQSNFASFFDSGLVLGGFALHRPAEELERESADSVHHHMRPLAPRRAADRVKVTRWLVTGLPLVMGGGDYVHVR